ncbi:hypothetical protein [Maridesulfovibrio frigidus]|uniref:hypothetical protein n=1 Tax=Maridesulfovibrio frigidus TaxID=340956 RepID=UPI0004E1DACB|nr:hypothetical protein [Maridesulfovibrio frigidus]
MSKSTEELIRPLTTEEVTLILKNFDLDEMAQEFYLNNADVEGFSSGIKSNNSSIENIFDGFIESKYS